MVSFFETLQGVLDSLVRFLRQQHRTISKDELPRLSTSSGPSDHTLPVRRPVGPPPLLSARRRAGPPPVRAARPPVTGPRGLTPLQFPMCPMDHLMNFSGKPQVIFWNPEENCYYCAHGHRFASNGRPIL